MITRALAVLLIASALGGSAVSGVAFAQNAPGQTPSTGGGFGPFGPIPQAPPEQVPLPGEEEDGGLTGRQTLYIVLGIVALGLIALGVFITRDARNAAPALVGDRVPDGDRQRDLVPGAPGERRVKPKTSKDKKKAKAARAARKRTTRQR